LEGVESKDTELEQLRVTARDSLFRIWKDSREKTARVEETAKGPYRLFSEANKPAIIVGPVGIVAFDRLVSLLSKHPVIGQNFSRKELEKRIRSLAIELYTAESTQVEERVLSLTDSLLRSLLEVIPTSWQVYLPVENLSLQSELSVGRASITMFDTTIEKSVLERFVAMNQQSSSPPEVKNEVEKLFVESLKINYQGRAVICVDVTTVDMDRAIDAATEEADTTLNVLRFYSRGVIDHDARNYKMYIGLKGSISRGQMFAFGFGKPDSFVQSFQNTGYLYPLELSEKALSKMSQDSFGTLHKILLKHPSQRTAFENLIVNSVNLFGRAMNSQDAVGALVSVVVALESIVLKKGEPMKTLLAERVALLLGHSFDERMFYFGQMSRLYQMRSDIVHRGLLDVTEGDFFLLSMMAYRVLVRLIADSSKLNDIGKLVEMFNIIKFGGKQESELSRKSTDVGPSKPA